MDYTEVETVRNATIIKGNDGNFGVLSKEMNSIIEYPQYDAYSILPQQEDVRYIAFDLNGKKGIFDAVKVEFIQHCMLSGIIGINKQKKVIEAYKSCIIFKNIKIGKCKVEIPIE